MMMKYRSIVLATLTAIFVWAHLSFSQVARQDSITVDTAIGRAIQQSLTIEQGQRAVEASGARIRTTRSGYLPTVDVAAIYTRLGPIPEIELPGGVFQLYPANNYDAHLEARQTLYDFGRTSSAVKLSEAQVQTSADRITITKREIAFQTTRLFYGILFIRQSIGVQDERIRTLNDHDVLIRQKVANGTATNFDVLTNQVRLAAAQDVKIDLEATLQRTEVAFRQLLNLPSGSPVILSGSFTVDSSGIVQDSAVAIALRRSTDLKLADDALRAAELQYQVASASDRPMISISASYGFKNGFIPNLTVMRGNYAAGVQIEVPIFNGFRTAGMQEEAQANVLSARAAKNDVERQIQSEVQQALADLRANSQKLQTSQISVQQARSALELANVRYKAGTITNLDLNDAETALQQAELRNLQSMYNYILSRYALMRVTGEQFWP